MASFAKAVIGCSCLHDKSLKDGDVQTAVGKIVKLFTCDAVIYDKDLQIVSLDGKNVEESSERLWKHSQGQLVDPFTKESFLTEASTALLEWTSRNLVHASHLKPMEVAGFSLPRDKLTPSDCTVTKLQEMVACRGGNGVSERGASINKPELVKIVTGFQLLEKEMPSMTVAFDQNPETNGLFLKCKDMNGRSVPVTIQDLLNDFVMKSDDVQVKVICKNVETAQLLLRANKFVGDYNVIAATTPELKPELIYREYSYIGESATQKNTGTSLSHALGQSELLYHSNAFSESRDTLWILSK